MEQTFLDLVEAVKIVPQKGISERTGEQFGVSEVPKNSGQENVVVTNVPQEQSSQRKGERIQVIELPKI